MARRPRGLRRKRYTVPKDDGSFPRKHKWRLDADLTAPAAFHNSRVEVFMEFITRYWRPEGDILLLSPCSNVKPYPLSPLNRKLEAAIKRSKAWDRVEWVFISDLLGPVPYKYTWIPPACCYDAMPGEVPDYWLRTVKKAIRAWWKRVKGYFTLTLIFLPRHYLPLVSEVQNDNEVRVTIVRYDIFYGQKSVETLLKSYTRTTN